MMINREQIENRIHRFFDENFYLSHYPDVAHSKINPLQHYVKIGWREKRKPNSWYSDALVHAGLIKTNPSTPPFVLFLFSVSDAELDGYQSGKVLAPNQEAGHDECPDCRHMRKHFDAKYYRRKYRDLAGVPDALAHYCEKGWKEHRDPSPMFSTVYYLQSNPDVAAAQVNPFVHYLCTGSAEARKPEPNDAVKKKLGQDFKTIRLVSLEYAKIAPQVKVESTAALFVRLFQSLKHSSSGLMLSISHDNYLEHTGGIQKFIHSESAWAQQECRTYLHLCPTQPDVELVRNALATAFLVNCTLNDEFIGTFTVDEVNGIFRDLAAKNAGNFNDAVIHSAMGWDLQLLAQLIGKNFKRTVFYAHDYFALCPEYRLLRNGLVSCSPTHPDNSASCTICAHKAHRQEHLRIFEQFFKGVRPHFIFPSCGANDIFAMSGIYPKVKSTVIPHLNVERPRSRIRRSAEQVDVTSMNGRMPNKLRVAFCGAPVGYKGFFHFEKISDVCRTVDTIEFMHLGAKRSEVEDLQFKEVKLHRGRSVMASAIKDAGVDLVFVGSTWRETFNFVAYEALQAGAALIALESSGNVADLVKAQGVGAVVADWQAACQLLKSKTLPTQVKKWKEAVKSLAFSENKSVFSLDDAI